MAVMGGACGVDRDWEVADRPKEPPNFAVIEPIGGALTSDQGGV